MSTKNTAVDNTVLHVVRMHPGESLKRITALCGQTAHHPSGATLSHVRSSLIRFGAEGRIDNREGRYYLATPKVEVVHEPELLDPRIERAFERLREDRAAAQNGAVP